MMVKLGCDRPRQRLAGAGAAVAVALVLYSMMTAFAVDGFFQRNPAPARQSPRRASKLPIRRPGYFYDRAAPVPSVVALRMNKKPREYSRKVLLREEAESPFRKVRFFFYFALGSGALVSLFLSATRVVAGLSGINPELLQESAANVGVDGVGLVVLAFLYRQDLKAEESRLQRATRGAELAKLMVRTSKSHEDVPVDSSSPLSSTFTTSLASMRRGRGIEKRVVIAAGGAEKLKKAIEDARRLKSNLSVSDLLLVPVVVPSGAAPPVEMDDLLNEMPYCTVALPVGGSDWKALIDDEAEEARKQGVDIENEGFCVILKKNGRVGQRTKGIFLDRMVGEVQQRKNLGLDVKNI